MTGCKPSWEGMGDGLTFVDSAIFINKMGIRLWRWAEGVGSGVVMGLFVGLCFGLDFV